MAVSLILGTIPNDAVLDMRMGPCGDCGREIAFSEGTWIEAGDLCRECLDKHLTAAPCWCFACQITNPPLA